MNKYRELANNTIVLAIGQFSSKLLVYFMLGFYTSMLGAEGFGDATNIINASALLISVVTLSISEGVLRYGIKAKKSEDGTVVEDIVIRSKKRVLSIGIDVTLVGLIVFAVFVPLIGFIEMLAGYEWLIYMYVFTGGIKATMSIYVRARGRVALFALDGILTTVAMILFNLLFLAVFDLGVVGYVLSVSMGDLCSIVFLTMTAKLYKDYRPLRYTKQNLSDMLKYSVPLMPTTVMWWIVNVSDTFMITAFFGSAANGVYSFAYKFPNLAATVVGIFSRAWHMSAIRERNSRTVSRFYSNVFDMMQTIMYVAAAGIMLVIRPIIMPLFGAEGFETAYFYVPVLLFAVVFQSFNSFLSSIYESSNKTMRSFVTSVVGAGTNIILNLILLNTIGVIGAAIATLASYLLVFVFRVIDTKKLLYMEMKWHSMAANLIALSLLALSVMFMEYGVLQNIINVIIFLAVIGMNYKSLVSAIKMFLSRQRNIVPDEDDDEENTDSPNLAEKTEK